MKRQLPGIPEVAEAAVVEPAPVQNGKLNAALNVVTGVLGGLGVFGLMLYVVANAVSRYVWNEPFSASLEIVQFLLMPALVTVSLVAAQLARQHVTADILVHFFPPAGRKWLGVGIDLLAAAVLAVLTWFTWLHAEFAQEREFKAGYTDIVAWPVYFFVPVAFGLCALLLVRDAWRGARTPVDEQQSHGSEQADHD